MLSTLARACVVRRISASHWFRNGPPSLLRGQRTKVSAGVATGLFIGGFTFVSCSSVAPPPFDVEALRADIEDIIDNDYSKGPQFIRLAWHEAGTWDKATKSGSPNSASMRFKPECQYAANKGLEQPREALEKLKKRHPGISYADLWSLAGCVAVEKMGGPRVTWKWGRVDASSSSACSPDGRLPDGSKTQAHIRDVFYRMGFNDEEIVALIGAHTCGECRLENSGFVGPWTHDKYGFDNSFFVHLLNEKWEVNDKVQKLQFLDASTKGLMMLPSDVALLIDPKFRSIAQRFAQDNDLFCDRFAKAFQKLLELGTAGLRSVG